MRYDYNNGEVTGTWAHKETESLIAFFTDTEENGGLEMGAVDESLLSLTYFQENISKESRAYLASTDWMAVREAETGTAMPADVKAKREEARAAVV